MYFCNIPEIPSRFSSEEKLKYWLRSIPGVTGIDFPPVYKTGVSEAGENGSVARPKRLAYVRVQA
jgi:hypothetical protein